MSYEPEIYRRAWQRLKDRKQNREFDLQRRRELIYQRLPRVREIDGILRTSAMRAAVAALRNGSNPAPALNAIHAEHKGLQEERSRLLSSAGFPENALDATPCCSRCGDSGYIGAQMCQCLRALCAEEQIKSLSSMLDLGSQSFDSFRIDYYPDSMRSGTMSPRQSMEITRDLCYQYADKFAFFDIKNLLMTGNPGLGKTYLSACIARVVSERGFSVVYDTAVHIFEQFEAQKFSHDAEAANAAKRYLTCDLLILDDLGSEMTTSLTQTALYTIINSRLVSGKHTVFSTNLSLNDIGRRYSPQVYSRLAGDYQILTFTGEDIRIQKSRERI